MKFFSHNNWACGSSWSEPGRMEAPGLQGFTGDWGRGVQKWLHEFNLHEWSHHWWQVLGSWCCWKSAEVVANQWTGRYRRLHRLPIESFVHRWTTMDQELAESCGRPSSGQMVCAWIWSTLVQPIWWDSRVLSISGCCNGLRSPSHFHLLHTIRFMELAGPPLPVLDVSCSLVFVFPRLSWRAVLHCAFHDVALPGGCGLGLWHFLYWGSLGRMQWWPPSEKGWHQSAWEDCQHHHSSRSGHDNSLLPTPAFFNVSLEADWFHGNWWFVYQCFLEHQSGHARVLALLREAQLLASEFGEKAALPAANWCHFPGAPCLPGRYVYLVDLAWHRKAMERIVVDVPLPSCSLAAWLVSLGHISWGAFACQIMLFWMTTSTTDFMSRLGVFCTTAATFATLWNFMMLDATWGQQPAGLRRPAPGC